MSHFQGVGHGRNAGPSFTQDPPPSCPLIGKPDLHSLGKPVIAAVNGVAYGARFGLALACDVILASEKARFCQVFVHVGLAPDAGSTYFLPRMFGTARTFPLISSGEPIGAQGALALGRVRNVVPGEKLPEEALAFAKRWPRGQRGRWGWPEGWCTRAWGRAIPTNWMKKPMIRRSAD